MKTIKNNFRFVILVLIIAGCNGSPLIGFKSSQPEDGKSIKNFSKKMVGYYLSVRDSSTLIISTNSISREYLVSFAIDSKSADTSKNYILKKDTLIEKNSDVKLFVKKIGDTLRGEYHWNKELFKISETNILKKLNGKYFLNFNRGSEDEGSWEVWELEYKKGKLWIGQITKQEDITKLQKITETSVDSITNLTTRFEPTKRQLRKFIRQDGFGDKEEFVKIK